MTTEERLARVEKELARGRRLNHYLLAVLSVALGAWVLAWALGHRTPEVQKPKGAAKEVRAKAFILEDENGKVRAAFSMEQNGPVLRMRDENGNACVEMHESGLSVNDKHSKAFALVTAESGLSLSDENGKVRVTLNVDKNAPTLKILDEKGKERAKLYVRKDKAGLYLWDDEKDRTRATAEISVGIEEPLVVGGYTIGGGPYSLLRIKCGYEQAQLRADSAQSSAGLNHVVGEARMKDSVKGSDMRCIDLLASDDKIAIDLGGLGPEPDIQLRGASQEEGPRISIRDGAHNERAVLGCTSLQTVRDGTVEKRPESSLVLFDKDGKVRYVAP